ncbi:MAG: hypothetical protein QM784_15430 [Polyangiaceae bacterium]
MRQLEKDAGAVASERIASACATVNQIQKDFDTLAHDVMRRLALQAGNEANATGVMLESGVVQSRPGWDAHWRILVGLPHMRCR